MMNPLSLAWPGFWGFGVQGIFEFPPRINIRGTLATLTLLVGSVSKSNDSHGVHVLSVCAAEVLLLHMKPINP